MKDRRNRILAILEYLEREVMTSVTPVEGAVATKNIWICVIIHYLNNGMNSIIDSSTGESSLNFLLEIAAIMIAALLIYGVFIHAKVFQDNEIIDSFLLPRKPSETSQNDPERGDS